MTDDERFAGARIANGFDSALIGFGFQFTNPVAIYDYDKCIEVLMKDMDREDAEEYFDFNVIGAWVGESTPVFLYRRVEI